MRQRVAVWLFICLFGLGSRLAQAEWYPGIIHPHSTFSDGDRIPEMVMEETAKSGALFLIVTDHYEQINSSKSVRPDVPNKDFGFNNYKKRFARVPTIGDTAVPLVVIPGAEITTYWNGAASHALALGDLAFWDNKLSELQMKENTQQAVIDRLNKLGLLPTAAHPSFVTPFAFRAEWAAISNYQFDPAAAKGLRGIEIFNDHNWEQYKRTRDWYLSLLMQGNDVFVTSGCDSHSALEPKDADRWTRKTWVFCGKLEAKAILDAIAKGQTYAANFGASLESLNYTPGFQWQEAYRPKFKFDLMFEKKITSPKIIQIYRDGKLIPDSRRTCNRNTKRFQYFWEDEEVGTGLHWYVIEVEGVLITSPIKLQVELPPKSAQNDVNKFIPRNYRIVRMLDVDLDGDRDMDVIIALEPQNPQYGTPNATQCAKVMVLFRQGKSLKKVWEFDDGTHVMGRGGDSKSQELLLVVEDINRDGMPEIVFSMAYIGASDANIGTYVFVYRQGSFVSLFSDLNALSHPLDGGVVLGDFDKSKKGKELLVYGFIWDEHEAHYDPHRYRASYYFWNPKSQKYVRYRQIQTRQKGKTGLLELGLAR